MASTGKVGSYGLKEVADVRFYSIATDAQSISIQTLIVMSTTVMLLLALLISFLTL